MPSKHALAMVGAAVGALVLLAVATIATNSAPITMTALDAEHVPLKKALKSLESSPVVNGVAQALESSLAQTYQRQRLIKAEHAKPLFVPKPVHKPLKYGDKITLRDAYNEYILCSRSGQLSTGRVTSSCSEELSFSGCADHVQIVSAKGKKGSGEVQYGDSVALIGRNGKYFMVRACECVRARVLASHTYHACSAVPCRAAVLTPGSMPCALCAHSILAVPYVMDRCMLCRAALCCAAPCRAAPCRAAPRSAAPPCCIAPRRTALATFRPVCAVRVPYACVHPVCVS